MPPQDLLGLPPVSSELKSILPFLQRAEELKKQEPIIAYWCAYYAAQVGISLKARDSASRDLLFSLLGVLENMKKAIGTVDAIEIEAASAAYVENFALKIFSTADNEDRRGAATKATARKFLVASNFLEVLRTFPKTELSESTEEKARYAKWKAADISRALREGRAPTPGPAGQDQGLELAEDQFASTIPTSRLDQTDTLHVIGDPHPSEFQAAPESWSTTATPGATHDTVYLPQTIVPPHSVPYGSPPENVQKGHSRSGSTNSTNSSPGSIPSNSKRAWVSDELEEKVTPSSSPPHSSALKQLGSNGSPEGKKTVHFSHSPVDTPSSHPPPPPLPQKPPSPKEAYQGPPSIYAAPTKGTPSPPSVSPTLPEIPPPPISSYSPPRNPNIYAHPPPPQPPYGYSSVRPAPAHVLPSHPVELSPSVINKAQKHCRFAISALDYEDVEQAKKELRTALSILEGP